MQMSFLTTLHVLLNPNKHAICKVMQITENLHVPHHKHVWEDLLIHICNVNI